MICVSDAEELWSSGSSGCSVLAGIVLLSLPYLSNCWSPEKRERGQNCLLVLNTYSAAENKPLPCTAVCAKSFATTASLNQLTSGSKGKNYDQKQQFASQM